MVDGTWCMVNRYPINHLIIVVQYLSMLLKNLDPPFFGEWYTVDGKWGNP